MLGKKSSLKELVSVLKVHQVSCASEVVEQYYPLALLTFVNLCLHQVPVVTTTEFVQGKTWRWGIAWSFDASLKDEVRLWQD